MKWSLFSAALALASSVAYAQSDPPTMPPPQPSPPPQQPQPPEQNAPVPLSSFEAIQPPPPLGSLPADPAAPSEPLRLRIDPNLAGPGVAPEAAAQQPVPEDDRTEE
jgi:hypothetical protein